MRIIINALNSGRLKCTCDGLIEEHDKQTSMALDVLQGTTSTNGHK